MAGRFGTPDGPSRSIGARKHLQLRRVRPQPLDHLVDKGWLLAVPTDVRHGRYVVFQLAEVAVPRALFAQILRRIDRLRGPPVPAM